jgi:hypothetical protein
MSIVAALVVLGAAAFATSPAKAEFHLVKISEIGVSADGPSDSHYLELQMYSAGQNQMAGHNVTIWDEDGLAPPMALPGPIDELTLSVGNPANAQSQRTVLIGDVQIAGRDYTLDFTPYFDPGVTNNLLSAGAICFEDVDCVSWGGASFTGAGHLPDGTTPFDGPVASLLGVTAHQRTLARGCATALDTADDTNDAAADFTAGTPTPRPNEVAPTETLCAPPQAAPPVKKAKKKCKRKKAKKGEVSAAAKKKCKRKKRR